MVAVRAIVPFDPERHRSNKQVLEDLCFPHPCVLLAKSRLLYLARVARKTCGLLADLLRRLAGFQRSWWSAVVLDLEFLHRHIKQLEHMPPPSDQVDAWIELMSEHPRVWKSLVGKLNDCDVEQMLLHYGYDDAEVTDEQAPYPCQACDRVFRTHSAFRCHAAVAHGVRNVAVPFSNLEGVCTICLCKFHNRPRLIAHLTFDSPWCLEA
eukprot:9988400-Alexandrium_andersonii.AAC.1